MTSYALRIQELRQFHGMDLLYSAPRELSGFGKDITWEVRVAIIDSSEYIPKQGKSTKFKRDPPGLERAMLVIKPKGGLWTLPRSTIITADANVEAAANRVLLDLTGFHLNEVLACLPLESVVVEGRATGAILTYIATCNEVFNVASAANTNPRPPGEGGEFDWVQSEQEIATLHDPKLTKPAFNTMKDAFWCRTRTWLSTMTYLDLPYTQATEFIADFDYSVAIAVVRPKGKAETWLC